MIDKDPCIRHVDDLAVDQFSEAMRSKMKLSREKGRSGWHDQNQCSDEQLADLLVDHLYKGNEGSFEDVANFAMMLYIRKADPRVLVNAALRVVSK